MNYYAGIGSRQTPYDVLQTMQKIGMAFAQRGLILRSGGAAGADSAFESGVNMQGGKKEIFKVWHKADQEVLQAAGQIAASCHPAWHRCNEFARAAHTRNALIILGEDLNSPVDFVVCWTPGGQAVGGTAVGIRIACKYRIPVYNLWYPQHLQKVRDIYAGLKKS